MRYPEAASYGYDSDEFARHRRVVARSGHGPRKMRNDPDEQISAKTTLSDIRRDAKSGPLITPGPIFDANETHRLQKAFPEYSGLVELFIAHNGIESTLAALVSTLSGRIRQESVQLAQNNEALRQATGHIFERFAHYWLREGDTNGLYVDPGSCDRIFNRLTPLQTVRFVPDGAHFSFYSRKPTIDEIVECKLNPEKEADDTNNSIGHITSFLGENAGATFRFWAPVIIDKTKGISSRNLKISPFAKANLVIPRDRNFDAPEGVGVTKTPFDSYFVRRVATSVLQDISHHN